MNRAQQNKKTQRILLHNSALCGGMNGDCLKQSLNIYILTHDGSSFPISKAFFKKSLEKDSPKRNCKDMALQEARYDGNKIVEPLACCLFLDSQ